MSDSEKTLFFFCVYDLAGLSNSCTFYNAKISLNLQQGGVNIP